MALLHLPTRLSAAELAPAAVLLKGVLAGVEHEALLHLTVRFQSCRHPVHEAVWLLQGVWVQAGADLLGGL